MSETVMCPRTGAWTRRRNTRSPIARQVDVQDGSDEFRSAIRSIPMLPLPNRTHPKEIR
jgi:hypothetical protein